MHDIRMAFRAVRAAPVVSTVAILSLALGIGANTAMFSILDSLLLRALPVREPERLAMVGQMPRGRTSWTNPIWEAIRDRPQLFDGALAWSMTRFNLSQAGQTDLVDGIWTSGRYFELLGVTPILGRTWLPIDDQRGGGANGPVAVIGYDFWQRRFDGDANVIGRALTIERVPYTIVGVAPPGFFGLEVGRTFDVAIPIGSEPVMRGRDSALDRRSNWWLNIMVRLRPGQPIDAAERALREVQPQIREATIPFNYRDDAKTNYLSAALMLSPAATGESFLRRQYQRPLTTIMAVVGVVLLIACANIANLLLARATARRHELSVRVALGASRFRLARQFLVESLVLAGAGAALGLGFAYWFSRLLVRQLSTTTSHVFLGLTLDWRMLAFTAAIAVTTAILFGTLPALRATRAQPNDAMKQHGRSVIGDGRLRLGNLLVVFQVALSLMLIVAAGLFLRTFATLTTRDLGFDREAVMVAAITVQPLRLEPAARWELWNRIGVAAAGVPGVSRAALSSVTPISNNSWNDTLELLDGKPIAGHTMTYMNAVTPGWFATYGTKLLAGRDFTNADAQGGPAVAIVNEAFARQFTRGVSPIGHRARHQLRPNAPTPEREIIAVVADATYEHPRDAVPPTMYLPFWQDEQAPSWASLSVRATSGSPMLLTRSLAAALTQVNPGVAITFRPLSDNVNASLRQERLVAMLSGFFGGLALLLAALGLYGVTSYAVSRRQTEIGIRMALGAAPAGVITLVLGRVLLLVALGIVVGAGASLWASQFVKVLLFDMQPRDPLTLIVSAVVLGTIGALAGWVPARRASRVDPARVLRDG